MKNTIPKKNRCVVFATQKNPVVFHRPKKIPFGQNVRPKKILRAPPSLKYVSGAPGQTGQLTVSVNGKQNCHSFKSVPFPEKRQRRPESGIKDGFDEMEHEFPFGTFRPKNFLQTFCKTLNVWSNICIQNGSKKIINVAREAEA